MKRFIIRKNLQGVSCLRLTEETSGAQTYNNLASAKCGAKGFLDDLSGSIGHSYRWPMRDSLEKSIVDSVKAGGKISISMNEGHIVSGKTVRILEKQF